MISSKSSALASFSVVKSDQRFLCLVVHLLSPAHSSPYGISGLKMDYARDVVPSIDDYEKLWKLWDAATTSMVPKEELLSKPINLRNNLIFYLGHIPTFTGWSLLIAPNPPTLTCL